MKSMKKPKKLLIIKFPDIVEDPIYCYNTFSEVFKMDPDDFIEKWNKLTDRYIVIH